MSSGASLKRCIRTLADVCQELLQWMQLNFGKEFEKLKDSCTSIFFSLWTDHVATHISQQIEVLALLCISEPEAHDRFEMHFMKMIEVIDKWMMVEFRKGGYDENFFSMAGRTQLKHFHACVRKMVRHIQNTFAGIVSCFL